VLYIPLYVVVFRNVNTMLNEDIRIHFVLNNYYIYIYIYIHIHTGAPKVGVQYVLYYILYTYFWPTLYIYITTFNLKTWHVNVSWHLLIFNFYS